MSAGHRSVKPSSPIVAKSTSEHCGTAVGLPTSPGGSSKAQVPRQRRRLRERAFAEAAERECLVEIERRRQLKRVRARLRVGRAAFFFGRERVVFDAERRRLRADLDGRLSGGGVGAPPPSTLTVLSSCAGGPARDLDGDRDFQPFVGEHAAACRCSSALSSEQLIGGSSSG